MKLLRRAGIAVAGGIVVAVGVVTIPVPGIPSSVIIPLGLMILALEFFWARRLLADIKARLAHLRPPKAPLPGPAKD
jgi:uncharacterized protein (TIGR02611 family)